MEISILINMAQHKTLLKKEDIMNETNKQSKVDLFIREIIFGTKVESMSNYLDVVVDKAHVPIVRDGFNSVIIRVELMGIASGIVIMAILSPLW
jgi:hypothetical protein